MINYEKEMIRVQGLKKSFGKLPVLCGIDQVIYEGEVVSIIGPSGSGKSTFLRCLNLLEKPEEGQVFFEGTEITNKKLKKKELDQYRQKIGMVFQHFHVFPHLKVIENITLAPILEKKMEKAKAEAMAEDLLRRVCWISATSIRPSFPADRNSVWPLCGRWPWNRRWSCLMSRPVRWIRRWSKRFWMSSEN